MHIEADIHEHYSAENDQPGTHERFEQWQMFKDHLSERESDPADDCEDS